MKLRHIAIAVSAVFAAGAYAAGNQAAPGAETQSGQAGEARVVVPQGTVALTPELVTQVQQRLQAEGHAAGAIDGMWGPATQQGVLEFQQAQGLEASGQLNEETLAALGIGGESAATGGTGSAADSERSGNPPLPSRNIEEKSKFSGEPATGEERGAENSSGAGGTLEPERAPIPSRNIEERSKY